MKIPPPLAALAFLVSLNCVALSTMSGQPPPPLPPPPLVWPDGSPTAVIAFPNETFLSLRSRSGLFPLVATETAQSLNIQLRFPLTLGNTALIVQVLDGGALSNGQENLTIGLDGTASIQFQTGGEAGLYRVQLIAGGAITTLQFWASGP